MAEARDEWENARTGDDPQAVVDEVDRMVAGLQANGWGSQALDRVEPAAREGVRGLAALIGIGGAGRTEALCPTCSGKAKQGLQSAMGRLGDDATTSAAHDAITTRTEQWLEEEGLAPPDAAREGAQRRREAYEQAIGGCLNEDRVPVGTLEPGLGRSVHASSGEATIIDQLVLPAQGTGTKREREDRAVGLETVRAVQRREAVLEAWTGAGEGEKQAEHMIEQLAALKERLGECSALLCEMRVLADVERIRIDGARARVEMELQNLRVVQRETLYRMPIRIRM